MGRIDALTKAFISRDEVFADAFNFLIYGGRQVIRAGQLHELDTTEIVLPYGDGDPSAEPVQKYRDVLKGMSVTAVGMEDRNAAYLILGIENQTRVHYAMPVRNMLYDALQYSGQVEQARKCYKRENGARLTRDEFLSGFRREDRLLPVITLVIYFGADKWDAPKSVHEMLADVDPALLPFISDYRMNLIEPAAMDDAAFRQFATDLGPVLLGIKHSQDEDFGILENDCFRSMDRSAAELLNEISDMRIDLNEYTDREGRTDMCVAYQNSQQKARLEGILEGKREGILEGKLEGMREGKLEGKLEGALEMLVTLVRQGLLNLKDASVQAKMSEQEFAALVEKQKG